MFALSTFAAFWKPENPIWPSPKVLSFTASWNSLVPLTKPAAIKFLSRLVKVSPVPVTWEILFKSKSTW